MAVGLTLRVAFCEDGRGVRISLKPCGRDWYQSIEYLCESLQSLPCACLYPALTASIIPVLKRWKERFPARVWQRFSKVPQTAAFGVPRVCKEFNESCPALEAALSWLNKYATESHPANVIDLCSGFGFFSMFLAELAPVALLREIVLIDSDWPNPDAACTGALSNEHLVACGGWRVRLYSLKKNIKRGSDLRGIAKHVIGDTREVGPTFIAAIHLCGTLSLRAVQLYNDCASLGACGLCLVPCCLPSAAKQRKPVLTDNGMMRRWRRLYVVGDTAFQASEIDPPPPLPGNGVEKEGCEESGRRQLNRYTAPKPKSGSASSSLSAESPSEKREGGRSRRRDGGAARGEARERKAAPPTDAELAMVAEWEALRQQKRYVEADKLRELMRARGREPASLIKDGDHRAGISKSPASTPASVGGAGRGVSGGDVVLSGSGGGRVGARNSGTRNNAPQSAVESTTDISDPPPLESVNKEAEREECVEVASGVGGAARFERYTQCVFECIEALPEHKHRRLIKVHRTVGTNYRQNWHLFAQRPYVSAPSGDAEAHSALVECVGAPIVQEGWGEEEQPL
jgi:hypothetical protein